MGEETSYLDVSVLSSEGRAPPSPASLPYPPPPPHTPTPGQLAVDIKYHSSTFLGPSAAIGWLKARI